MAKFLTEEDFLNADSYVEIASKAAEARLYAQYCIDKAEVAIENDDGEKEALPPMYQENPMMKSLFGMQFLLYHYFHKIVPDENGDIVLTAKEYDEWGEGAILNSIERFKMSKNLDIRNKAFDIATDYREFYRMLGTEIASVLNANNDVIARFVQFFKSSITPDAFTSALKGLQDVEKEIEDYKSQPKEWQNPVLNEVK